MNLTDFSIEGVDLEEIVLLFENTIISTN